MSAAGGIEPIAIKFRAQRQANELFGRTYLENDSQESECVAANDKNHCLRRIMKKLYI